MGKGKYCTKCGIKKLYTEFDGDRKSCKSCVKEKTIKHIILSDFQLENMKKLEESFIKF